VSAVLLWRTFRVGDPSREQGMRREQADSADCGLFSCRRLFSWRADADAGAGEARGDDCGALRGGP